MALLKVGNFSLDTNRKSQHFGNVRIYLNDLTFIFQVLPNGIGHCLSSVEKERLLDLLTKKRVGGQVVVGTYSWLKCLYFPGKIFKHVSITYIYQFVFAISNSN